MAWDAGEARLEIVHPSLQGDDRVLANRRDVPNALGMWSAPTPPEGMEAEVIVLKRGTSEECRSLDLRGKIVLTSTEPRTIKAAVVAGGGIGVISDYIRNGDLRDATHWVNGWGDKPGAWMMTRTDSELFCFSISPKRGAWLRRLIRDRGPVRVWAKVDSRFYEGTLPYATGIIPGTEEKGEEVLLSGHLYEQGANDNASGTASILETARALNGLIERGVLPRPRRNIRFLHMAECYGSLAYAERHRERLRRTLTSVCVDSGAGCYDLVGSMITLVLSPHCQKAYVDALMMHILDRYFSRYARTKRWSTAPYQMATDTFFCDPAIGIPTTWPHMGMGRDYWHNSADSLDKVDPRSLRDLSAINGTFLYVVAAAGPTEAIWLAEETFALGMRNLTTCSKRLLVEAFGAEDEETLGKVLDKGLRRIAHFAEREGQALHSVERLTDAESLKEHVERLEKRLRHTAEEAQKGFEEALRRCAALKGMTVERIEEQEGAWEQEAVRIVPVRNDIIGTVALDDVPYEQWGVVDRSPRWWGPETAAWWWADGRRSVREIRDLVLQEFEELPIDLLDYFRFLEKHGYVSFSHL